MDYIAAEKNGKLELVPLTRCIYCLSEEHLIEDCPEKYDLFALTYNDEQFLKACGIFYPRIANGKFIVDPYKPPYELRSGNQK